MKCYAIRHIESGDWLTGRDRSPRRRKKGDKRTPRLYERKSDASNSLTALCYDNLSPWKREYRPERRKEYEIVEFELVPSGTPVVMNCTLNGVKVDFSGVIEPNETSASR